MLLTNACFPPSFTETTVLFADIVGFTAWSSVREPAQVFTLLETVYRAFDIIAKRRRVFKVETGKLVSCWNARIFESQNRS